MSLPRVVRRPVVLVACIAALSAGAPAPDAAAARPVGAAVLAPRPAGSAALTLVAASGDVTVFRQEHVGLLWTDGTAPARPVEPAPGDGVLRLSGTSLYERDGARVFVTDLVARTRTPVALRGREFLAAGAAGLVTFDRAGKRVLLTAAEGTRTLLEEVGDVGPPGVLLSRRFALVVHARVTGRPRTPRTVLVDLSTGAVAALSALGTPALSDAVVGGGVDSAWWGKQGDAWGWAELRGRATAGGTFRSVTVSGRAGPVAWSGGLAYVDREGRLALVPLDGGPVHFTDVDGVTGLATTDDGVRVVRSGPMSVAGVWTVGADGTARRDAAAAPYAAPVVQVRVAGGRLLVDRDEGGPVPVTTSAAILRDADGVGLGRERPAEGTGGWSYRYVTSGYPWSGYRFLDAGRPASAMVRATRNAAGPSSGPYLAIAHGAARADGVWIPGVPQAGDPMTDDTTLAGPLLLHRAGTGAVALQDLREPVGSALRAVVRPERCEGHFMGRTCHTEAHLVGGGAVALPGDGYVDVHDLATGTERRYPAARRPEAATVDGVLLRTGPSGTRYLLDVAGGATRSVPLAGVLPAGAPPDAVLSPDTGVAVWPDSAQAVHVAPLTGLPLRRPVLLGGVRTDLLTPDGDGLDDAWRPALDLTKPLVGARITLTRDGRVVRVLAVDARDGAVRHVRWDGRDADGAPVPDGDYRWELTGTSADGGGAPDGAAGPTDVDGRSPAAGTLSVRRDPLAVVLSYGPVRAAGDGTPQVRVRWRPVRGGRDLTYDVRVRTGGLPWQQPGEIRPWLTGTGERSAVLVGGVRDAVQLSARARTRDGVVGGWSPWTALVLPDDDDAFVPAVEGTTRRESLAGAYGGSVLVLPGDGVRATAEVDAERLRILGTRCPRCGRLRVHVDGEQVATVDTRAGSVRTGATLVSVRVPWGLHRVQVEAVGGPVMLDALAIT